METQPIEGAIVIHENLVRKFMRYEKDFANLLALYTFYLYHAKDQRTNRPLATDQFTANGMNWAIDRVKRIKRILKKMKVIEVVQVRKYSYIHLFFIYTKKKVEKILGKVPVENLKEDKAKTKEKPKKITKSVFESALLKNFDKKVVERILVEIRSIKGLDKYIFSQDLLAKWIIYCHKNHIKFNKNNLKNWITKLNKRLSIEQEDAINKAIKMKWKDFYMLEVKKSEYHNLLGQSLMMDKDCDTLLDIGKRDYKFVYKFKNIDVVTEEQPVNLFNRYGYQKSDKKNAPIISEIKKKLLGAVKKF